MRRRPPAIPAAYTARPARLGRSAATALAAVLLAAGCSGDSDSGSDGRNQGGVRAAPGSPQVCQDLAAEDRLTGLRGAVREAAAGRPLSVDPAVRALVRVSSEFPSAQRAADALERWSSAPSDTARLDELAASFTALEGEVQARCDFPVS
jgi:hypothetical protein